MFLFAIMIMSRPAVCGWGWAEKTGEGRWRFTPEGFLLSNQLIGDLLERQERSQLSDTLERARRQYARDGEM